ncbi:GLIPR1-like protein 1 [Saccostrea cucullata]|uniref:GLIPR1-like protein 1 n=1 Tax=Saccostrea cuccullata TaxID=36930 RepID=UPI002ED3BFA8
MKTAIFIVLTQAVIAQALVPADYVQAHNNERRNVSPSAANMKEMKWDDSLANIAQSWVSQCIFGHNPSPTGSRFSNVGENVYVASFTPSASSVVSYWASESSDYSYSNNYCFGRCGHYTQVVWADSEYLGCAENPNCSGKTLVVCNYGPAGNFNNQRPYISGPSCSQCPSGYTCNNGLCQ